jgi:hypothetical protein
MSDCKLTLIEIVPKNVIPHSLQFEVATMTCSMTSAEKAEATQTAKIAKNNFEETILKIKAFFSLQIFNIHD